MFKQLNIYIRIDNFLYIISVQLCTKKTALHKRGHVNKRPETSSSKFKYQDLCVLLVMKAFHDLDALSKQ